MKRILVTVLGLGLVVGSIATAEASKPRRVERTVTGRYGPYPAPITGCNEPLGYWACLIVSTRRTEAYFTANVTDAHGQPVLVEVLTSDGWRTAFCGKTTKPIGITPGSDLSFHIAVKHSWPPGVTLECPGNWVKTTGTISVTLSNLR